MTTEIGRVKCWISTERLRQKNVLGKETGMVYNVKTTTTKQQHVVFRHVNSRMYTRTISSVAASLSFSSWSIDSCTLRTYVRASRDDDDDDDDDDDENKLYMMMIHDAVTRIGQYIISTHAREGGRPGR